MFKPGHMGIYLVTDYHRQMGALNNNFENVSKFNVSRMAIRLLMRGYAKGNRAKYLVGVELEEFEQFYNDARALGVDLKLCILKIRVLPSEVLLKETFLPLARMVMIFPLVVNQLFFFLTVVIPVAGYHC